MNLLCRTRTILDRALIDARKPVRALSLAASVGLVVGYGSFAIGAAPLTTAAVLQDEDHQKDHDVHRHKVYSDADGKIEVIVVGDDEEKGDNEKLHRHLVEILHNKAGKIAPETLVEKLKSDHKLHVHGLDGSQDGKIEVIVVGDDEKKGDNEKLHRHLVELLHNKAGNIDPEALVEKLKSDHKLHVHGLDGGQDGNIKVVVVGDDEQDDNDKKRLHNHAVELLHRSHSDKVDHHELANQLRKIADQLDGNGHSAHSNHRLHSHLKMLEGGNINVLIERLADGHKGSRLVEIKPGSGKHVVLGNKGDAKKLIIEKLSADDRMIHVHGDQAKVILHALGDDDDQNVIVQEIHVDRDDNSDAKAKVILHALEHGSDHNIVVDKINVEQKRHKHELRFGNGSTSDEETDQDLRELRKELQKLREEVNKLRSDQPAPAKKRGRVKEERKTGIHELVSDDVIRVFDRRKKEQSADDQGEAGELLWVEDAGEKKSGNRFLLKKSKDSTGNRTPAVFRYDFKAKDGKSDDASKGKKKK